MILIDAIFIANISIFIINVGIFISNVLGIFVSIFIGIFITNINIFIANVNANIFIVVSTLRSSHWQISCSMLYSTV